MKQTQINTSFFPYPKIRPQQLEIMNFVQTCLDNEETAIIEAATGIGKTAATLSPLLEYLLQYNNGKEAHERLKLVIVGRTHSQADRVIDELIEIKQQTGKTINALSKRGKQALCINKEVKKQTPSKFQAICNSYVRGKKCKPFLNAHTPSNIMFTELLTNKPVTSNLIINESIVHNCCPAEITNQLIRDVDIIACSYHYLFSEEIRMRFLSSLDIPLEQLIIVVDECHNLPEATIQINTLRILSTQVANAELQVRRSNFNGEAAKLQRKYTVLTQALLDVMMIENNRTVSTMDLLKMIERKMQMQGFNEMLRPEILEDLEFLVAEYLKLSTLKHHSYMGYVLDVMKYLFKLLSRKDELILQYEYDEKYYLELKVMDPKFEISNVLQKAHFSVLMTGTLGNSSIFLAQTGLFRRTTILQLPSPYEQDLGVYQVKGLTSKYTERGKKMFNTYIEVIHTICEAPVNVGLYVTSYTFLDALFDHGLDRITKPIYRAEQFMNSHQTENLLNEFRGVKDKGGGLLCSVMGGRSSEGTDFPGDEMEIVIIAGIPYPPQSHEQEARFNYYSKLTKSAWNICYAAPAFRSINQAAGRVIRSLSDRALIFLLDDRIESNKTRLTGWLKSGLETIEINQISKKVHSYFG